MTENLSLFLARSQKYSDDGLNKYLPKELQYPESVHKSMRYSIFAGGKRIRPALCLASYELCNGKPDNENVRIVACALEMLHVFSLIHDDLPCMDDDDFRRGKPTNHKVYGDAIAVLAGDALCIHAFELLSLTNNCQVISVISKALGTSGMIGGQVVDIESEGVSADLKTLEYIHNKKTAAFITASLKSGAMLANASADILKSITEYGNNIGLAFQVIDDILDVTGTTEQIGKDAGSDLEKCKLTYPSLLGLEKSKIYAFELIAQAKKSILCFGDNSKILCDLADYIIERMN